MKLFPFFYYFLCCVAYCLAFPFILLFSFKKKYQDSIPARFFYRKLDFKPHYWFHACSLGESKTYEPIIKSLLKQEKSTHILLTCATNTGFAYLSSLADSHPQRLKVAYLPFEIFLPLWLPSLSRLRTLIVTEAELWKMLFWICKKAKARTLLINVHISDRMLKTYTRFRFFYRTLFPLIDITLAQLPSDVERLIHLGARDVRIFGNLKLLSTPQISHCYTKTSPIILGASTHADEEKLITQAFIDSKVYLRGVKLLIAPRHPERFTQVKELLRSLAQTHHLIFSTFREEWEDIVLVDSLGELNNLYAIVDCVILGGSFELIGGHNPLEPAFFNVPILSGEYIFNQKALFALVENAQIISQKELPQKLSSFDTLPKTKIIDSANKMQDLIMLIRRID